MGQKSGFPSEIEVLKTDRLNSELIFYEHDI